MEASSHRRVQHCDPYRIPVWKPEIWWRQLEGILAPMEQPLAWQHDPVEDRCPSLSHDYSLNDLPTTVVTATYLTTDDYHDLQSEHQSPNPTWTGDRDRQQIVSSGDVAFVTVARPSLQTATPNHD